MKPVVLALLDAGIIVSVLYVACALRFFQDGYSVWAHINTSVTLARVIVMLLACQLSFYYYDLYDLQCVRRRSTLIVHLLYACGAACLILGLVYYAAPELMLGRGVALIAAPLLLLSVLISRLVLVAAPSWQSFNNVLVVGTAEDGITVVKEILERPELNLKVIGFLDEKGENIGKSLVNPGIIGAVKDVEAIAAEKKVERVVLALAERRGQTPVQSLLRLKFAGIQIEDAHTVYEQVTGRILLKRLMPSALILSTGFRKSRLLLTIKRMADILVSLVGSLIALPLMAVIGLAIYLESGGPILFRQRRVGFMGREFELLKFRSMFNDDQDHPRWATQDDHRITRVGRLIRKFRVDELPQLINVLRGDMSMVGPRPEQPRFCEMLEQQIPFYSQRHTVRPGLTGWAQIKYHYGASVQETKNKLEYDLFYIKHMSLPLDLAILFETCKVVLSGRGAM